MCGSPLRLALTPTATGNGLAHQPEQGEKKYGWIGGVGMTKRCSWCGDDPLYVKYHDEEWGVPVWDDQKLFEFLILEGAQAGLSWLTILRKRENYRAAYDGFDPLKVAGYGEDKIKDLLANKGIIRNRRKIEGSIKNARCFMKIQEEFGSFAEYIWRFVDGKPRQNKRRSLREIPPQSPESEQLSKDLVKRGFKFAGPTIMYAHMQATGMVNDHVVDCFRYQELGGE